MANLSLKRSNTKPKYSADYWSAELQNAEDRRKKMWEQGQESIKVYNTTHDLQDVQRKLNCWWYCVNMLLPAYFSSTPKVEVSLRKRAGSNLWEMAAVVVERSTQFCMDEHFDFEQLGLDLSTQFLLVGQGVGWARYEAEVEEQERQIGLVLDANGNPYDGENQPYEPLDGDSEIQQGDAGAYVSRMIQAKTSEKAVLDLVQYNDFLTSAGRTQQEIEWKSRRAFMDEDEVTEHFGKDVAKKLTYNQFPESVKRDKLKDQNLYNGKAALWEVWCEESDTVYWIQRNGEKSVIEKGPVPVKYSGFYPCEEMTASTDPDSTIPVSDYVHCRDQIIEVERLTTRIHAMMQAIRANHAYDSGLGTTVEDLITSDLKMVPIKNWPAYKSRGGLASGMEAFNIDPYVKALQVLSERRTAALQQLYETLKVTDLLRGASDPSKTATANRLESQWSSLGLIVRQNQFAKFIGRLVGKLGTIIATNFSPETMFDMADADELIVNGLGGDPQQAAAQLPEVKMQIAGLLKDNIQRGYRIQIASDSMVALNERQERQDGADLMASAGSFFDQMKGLIEQYPPLAPFTMQMFQNVVRRYRGGKELEPVFMNALAQLTQIAQQKQADAQKQMSDPNQIASQTQIQIAQIDAQTKVQIEQMRQQAEAQKVQFQAQAQANLEAMKEQSAQQIESLKGQIALIQLEAQGKLDAQAMQSDAQLKMMQAQIDAAQAQAGHRLEQEKAAFDAQMKLTEQNHKLEIETLKARAEMTKAQLENQWQMAEAASKRAEQAAKTQMPAGKTLPDIHIHTGGKKVTKAKKLADGSWESTSEEA